MWIAVILFSLICQEVDPGDAGYGPPIATAGPTRPPEPQVVRLENGLRVVLIEDRTLPLFSVQHWIRHGAAGDDPASSGLCRTVQALLENRNRAAWRLRAAGLRHFSQTQRDACLFATTGPPEFLDFVLEIESQRLAPGPISAAELAASRRVAAQPPATEMAFIPDSAYRELLAASYPLLPYRNLPGILSTAADAVGLAEVQQLIDQRFVAANAVLVIIGDFDVVAVGEIVRQRFGSLPWRDISRRPETDSPPRDYVALSSSVRTGAPQIAFAWVTPPLGYFENAAIDLLMHRLCNGVDGSLTRALAGLDKPAAGQSSATEIKQGDDGSANADPFRLERATPRWKRMAWRDGGLLVLVVDLPDERPELRDQASRAVADAIEAASRENANEVELLRARALTARDYRETLADFEKRALLLGANEVIAGDSILGLLDLPRAKNAGVADLRAAAEILLDTRRVVLHLGRGAAPTGALPAAALVPLAPVAEIPGIAPREFVNDASALNHSLPTLTGRSPNMQASTTEIAPGLRLTLRAIPALGETVVSGNLSPALSPAAAQVLIRLGTPAFSAAMMQDYLSYRGLALSAASNGRELLFRGANVDVERMLELQAELICRARLDPAPIAAARHAVLELRRPRPGTPALIADELASRAMLLGDSVPTSESIRDELSRLQGQVLAGKTPVAGITVVGDFDQVRIADVAKRIWQSRLSRADAGQSAAAAQPVVPQTGPSDSPRVLWWQDASTDGLEVRAIVPFGGVKFVTGANDPGLGTVRDELSAWLSGVALQTGPLIDERYRWAWWGRIDGTTGAAARCRLPDFSAASFDAITVRGEVQETIRTLDEAQAATFLHQARMSRLLSLTNPAAIVTLDSGFAGNPWSVDADVPPRTYLNRWGTEAVPRRTDFVVVGGDRALLPALEKIGPVTILNQD